MDVFIYFRGLGLISPLDFCFMDLLVVVKRWLPKLLPVRQGLVLSILRSV